MSKVSNHILSRVYILLGVFLFLALLIFTKITGLQLNRDHWVRMESEERIEFKRVLADRGSILAEDGRILAASIPYFRIALDPTVFDTTEISRFKDSLFILSSNLADRFGKTLIDTLYENDTTYTLRPYKDSLQVYTEVLQALHKKDRHVYLTRKLIDFQELREVRTWPLLNKGTFPSGGLIIEKMHNQRYYPFGDLARITLGRLINDTTGIRGIEHAFNREMRGRDSYLLIQKVAGNSYIPLDKYGTEYAEDGMDIVTTLDVDLQDIVERALQKGVQRNAAQFGAAILLDVQTGQIKAMANYPEDFNYAVVTKIEPGSTFKLVSATAALEDSLIDLCDTVDTGNGTIMYDNKLVTDDVVIGKTTFEQVFANSSNVGMSKVIQQGYGKNPTRFIERLNNFGFNQPANSQLAGEPHPVVHKPGDEMWNAATTLPSMAYGYSVEATPLQMATFYNSIANGGKRMRPYLVSEIRYNSEIVKSYGPETLNDRICSPQTIQKVHSLMEKVVNIGSAKYAFKKMPFQVAGKTGTVRKFINGGYRSRYRASFGGFFPADQPRYTCFIMVDDPKARRISGGSVAAPIFREIALNIYNMDRKMTQEKMLAEEKLSKKTPLPTRFYAEHGKNFLEEIPMSQVKTIDEGKWLSREVEGDSVILRVFSPENTIPDLIGMSSRDAIFLLESLGVRVKLRGFGKVKRQSLSPGYTIGERTKITLTLG